MIRKGYGYVAERINRAPVLEGEIAAWAAADGAQAGFSAAERCQRSILRLEWAGIADISAAFARAFGGPPPALNGAVTVGAMTAIAHSPRSMLVVSDNLDASEIVEKLREFQTGAGASFCDVGHGHVAVALDGPGAQGTLSGLVPVDLERQLHAPGSAIRTVMHGHAVLIHAVGADQYDLYFDRSMALSAWRWLIASTGSR